MKLAIGALGGSGTRAVAQVFINAGINLGDDLNLPNDNLVFTRLFKNPCWYKKSSKQDISKRLDAFENYSQGQKLSFANTLTLINGALGNSVYPSEREFYSRIIKRFLGKGGVNSEGWKEPNTQIYLPYLLNKWTELKYIHVVRHGLDMAFSKNTQQLQNWGWKYNLQITGNETDKEIAQLQLKYWIATTQEIITLQQNHRQNILILNHSHFCSAPAKQIRQLLEFSNVLYTEDQLKELSQIPKNTGSNNRYKEQDISFFAKEDIDFVKHFGFEI